MEVVHASALERVQRFADKPLHVSPARFPEALLHFGSHLLTGLRWNPDFRLTMEREAVAEEHPVDRAIHPTFRTIDLQLQFPFEEPDQIFEHALPAAATAHLDVAVIRIATKRVTALFHFLSRSSSRMFDSNGESDPPCGVPFSLG